MNMTNLEFTDVVLLFALIIMGYLILYSFYDRTMKAIEHCSNMRAFRDFFKVFSKDGADADTMVKIFQNAKKVGNTVDDVKDISEKIKESKSCLK